MAESRFRIGIVDDEKVARLAWEHVLSDDAHVETFTSPEDFDARYPSGVPFDILITDLNFGKGSRRDGNAFARDVRSRFSGSLFVATVAESGELTTRVSEADAYIRKNPCPLGELLPLTRKNVVINADDYGMSEDTVEGILEAHRAGAVIST